MDVRYINPFIASVINVFETMVATKLSVGKPAIATAAVDPRADVSAVIGLSGDAVGCVVLSFSIEAATQAASKFAGAALSTDHPDFTDALGELANMVAGQAKSKLEGLNCSISLPSVVIGEKHIVAQSRSRPRLILPCHSELGEFHVEVTLVVGKKTSAEGAKPAVAAGAIA